MKYFFCLLIAFPSMIMAQADSTHFGSIQLDNDDTKGETIGTLADSAKWGTLWGTMDSVLVITSPDSVFLNSVDWNWSDHIQINSKYDPSKYNFDYVNDRLQQLQAEINALKAMIDNPKPKRGKNYYGENNKPRKFKRQWKTVNNAPKSR